MTVKELIAKLSSFNPDREVFYYVEERDCERSITRAREREVEVRYDITTRKSITELCIVLDNDG